MVFDKILLDKGINDYWLIEHHIDRHEFHLTNGIKNYKETEEFINDLFFLWNNNLYKITYGIIDNKLLEVMIDDVISDSVFGISNPMLNLDYNRVNMDDFKVLLLEKDEPQCIAVINSELEKFEKKKIQVKINMINEKSYLFYKNHKVEKKINKCDLEIFDMEKMYYQKKNDCVVIPGFVESLMETNSVNRNYKEKFELTNGFRFMRLSNKVFYVILKVFAGLFNGIMIINNQSFIKKDDFGKMIVDEKISIKHLAPQEPFDSEGMSPQDIYLIKEGRVEGCLNNIYSASALAFEPGDSSFNYELKTHIIKVNDVLFEYDNDEIIPDADAYFDQIKEETISFDYDSGNMGAVLIGRDRNKTKMFNLKCNAIDLLNSIVGVSTDSYYKDDKIQKSDVIIDLSKI